MHISRWKASLDRYGKESCFVCHGGFCCCCGCSQSARYLIYWQVKFSVLRGGGEVELARIISQDPAPKTSSP